VRDHPFTGATAIGTLAAIGLLANAGCGRDPEPPELELAVPATFAPSGTHEPPERWWTAFDDAELDERVERALGGNFDLKSAWERLQQAQAVLAGESAARWPAIDAETEGSIQRTDRHVDGALEQDGDSSERLALGLAAAYEVDLWGRISAQVAAERFRVQASLADYRAAALSLTAEIAQTWYALVEVRGQLELLEEQIATNAQVLSLLRERFGGGDVRAVDIIRQEQLLESTREGRSAILGEIAVLEHRLAVLEGRAPQGPAESGRHELPELPATPDAGLPSDLVLRRPDVLRAQHLLHAANRELAVAISNRYPRLTLSASVTTVEGGSEQIFRNWLSTLAGNLLGPIVDGGRRKAAVHRQESIERQRLFAYAQTILTAFQEVEDALERERHQRARIASIRRQIELSRESYRRLRSEYLGGVSDYIDVLTALAETQRLQRELLVARRQRIVFRIALYRALAGGFETPLERKPMPDARARGSAEDGHSEGTDEP